MNRSLVALAASASLAGGGVASAQSSVTLFGILDASVSAYRNQAQTPLGNTVSTSQTMLTNSAYNSSRLGFRGTEDLGGGLAAGFWLEAGINNDDGSGSASGGGLQFNRRSTVSLSDDSFGEVRIGRDHTPTYWNDILFDPFGANGVGANLIGTASGLGSPGSYKSGFTANDNYSRASNSIGYFLPLNLGGLYGQFMYAFNEAVSYDPGGLTPPGAAAIVVDPPLAVAGNNARAGRYIGGRVGYNNGPLDVAVAYGESTIASNYYQGTTTTVNIWNLGASYDFGVAKLFGEYSNNKQATAYATNTLNPFGLTMPGFNGALIGLTVAAGPGLIRASYSEVRYNNVNNLNFTNPNPNPKADKFAIGYVYNLAKRTALYATVAYLNDKDGAGLTVGGPSFYSGAIPTGGGLFAVPAPNKSVGYDVGLRHSF